MKWDDLGHSTPCAKCPYRRDAPLKLWHPSEFRKVLRGDADPLNGPVFGCHNDSKKSPERVRPCIGWLLDQDRRGCPSIQLRMALAVRAGVAECMDRIHSSGLELYASIQEMCRANGVRALPRARRAKR